MPPHSPAAKRVQVAQRAPSPAPRASERRRIWLLLAVALALGAPSQALAHARSISYSSWHLTDDGARVQLRIPLLELSRLAMPLPLPGRGGDDAPVGRYLASHLELLAGGSPCPPDARPAARSGEDGWVVYRWTLTCAAGGARTIRTAILLEQAPSHLHFARLNLAGDGAGQPGRILERVLVEASPEWKVGTGAGEEAAPAETVGSSLGAYVVLGIEHILTGWDHLAFVLALVLLARTLGEVARLVTGFTVAHSITLALAVLGVLETRAAPVEALIGFSVALIAVENAWLESGRGRAVPALATGALLVAAGFAAAGAGGLPTLALLGLALFTASHFGLLRVADDPALLRTVLAFAFGLVHGFGFAGILAEMSLPTERLAAALLGFNVGVEVGQLAAVALVWPLLMALRRTAGGTPHRLFADVAGAAVCGLGLFWFVTRAFGPGAL